MDPVASYIPTLVESLSLDFPVNEFKNTLHDIVVFTKSTGKVVRTSSAVYLLYKSQD